MTDQRSPIAAVIGLPPDDTVRAFEARDDLRATVRWSEMWHEDHARAFTVAKVAQLDLLADIRASLDKVMREGGTLAQWQAGLVPTLKARGWWGEVEDRSLTGTGEVVNVGPRRLRTIYDTNLRMSRAAGRWKRIQELKDVRPFLMYVAIGDSRTRPLHRLWGGLDPARPIRVILPVDHPAWAIFYPPNDWGCRCTVRQLSQRELDRKGWRVTTEEELIAIGWATAGGVIGGRKRTFQRATGETVDVPIGIGPGFAYNPGKASMRAIADKAVRSLDRLAPTDLAAARAVLDDLVRSDAFLETLNDPAGLVAVGVLDERVAGIIGAANRVPVLSSYTYSKQLGRLAVSAGHLDLTVADYRLLPEIFAAPDRLFTDRPGKAEFVASKTIAGRLYRAAFKVLGDKGEIFVTSYRRARAADVRRDARWSDLLDE